MPNTYSQHVSKFMPTVEKLATIASLTSGFLKDPKEWIGTNTIMRPSVTTGGAGNYSTETGYAKNTTAVKWESYDLNLDRSTTFKFDYIENQIVPMNMIEEAIIEFERMHKIPEDDAVRFSNIAADVKTHSDAITDVASKNYVIKDYTTSDEVIAAIDDVEEYFTANGIPFDGASLWCDAATYRLIKEAFKGSFSLETNSGKRDRNVMVLDSGLYIKKVPNNRFFTDVELEANNGYKPSATSARINFIVGNDRDVEAYYRRNVVKVHDNVVGFDGVVVEMRWVHDCFIDVNKRRNLYVSVAETVIA